LKSAKSYASRVRPKPEFDNDTFAACARDLVANLVLTPFKAR
jgi:hypothetical protein